MSSLKEFINKKQRELVVVVAIVLLTIVFTALYPAYFSWNTFTQILQQATINGIIAIGMTFAIISGGIDLSVGSVFAIIIVAVGTFTAGGLNPIIAAVIGAALGGVIGSINGFLITKMNLQPFIATLGTMSVFRGVAYVITGGWPVLNIPDSFRDMFNHKIVQGVPNSVILMLILAVIMGVILNKTRFGNYLYSVGGNEEAAKLSGVNVDRTKIMGYVICGVCAAFAGMVMLASLGTGEPAAGQGYELDAIAAAAIGGTRMAGGKGTILGTVLGAILLSALKIGMILLNVDTFYQYIATGVIIVLAAYFEFIQDKVTKMMAKNK
ncbi:MAG: ABC transporter permease [Candidatus Avilachnospira sp.]